MQRTGTNPLADLKLLKHIYRQIRQIQPEYVLSYTIKPVIYGTLASWLAKVPHRFALITGLGYAFQNVESGKRSFFKSWCMAYMRKRSNVATKSFSKTLMI